MRKFKVCIVGSSNRFFSGLTAHTVFLANAFFERGHEVSVILLRNLVPRFLYPGRGRVGRGEYLVNFLPGIVVYDGMDWNSPRTWAGALRFVSRCDPDVMIIFWWTSSVAHMELLLALGSRLGGKRCLILEVHEVMDTFERKFLPLRIYSRVTGRMLVRLCDVFTVHLEEVRREVIATYGVLSDRTYTVPIGIYEAYGTADREAARRKLELEGFVILYFGMIRQYKGVPVLVEAFDMLPEEIAARSRLVIAGEDWGDDPGLHLAVERSPYRDRILFRPQFVPDAQVPEYFAAADVVVLPYLRTSGSGVANIARAQGKFIVAPDLPTMRECLADYRGVHFFSAGDSGALRDALVGVYTGWAAGGMGRCPVAGVGWDDVVRRYEEIICQWLDNREPVVGGRCASHR